MPQNPKKLCFWLAALVLLLLPAARRCATAALFALFLAALLCSPVRWLEQHRLPRWLSVALVFTAMLGAISTLTYFALTRLVSAAGTLTAELTNFSYLFQHLDQLTQHFPDALLPAVQALVTLLEQQSRTLTLQLSSYLTRLSTKLLKNLPQQLFFTMITLLSAFYATLDWHNLRSSLSALLPHDWRKRIRTILTSLKKGALCWLKVQGKLLLIQLILLLGGLTLLRISSPMLAALLIAFADALPLFGSGTILLPWAFFLWLEQQPVKAVGIALLWIVCWLSRTILEPRMVGYQAGVSPFYSLLALYFGALTLGFWGLILAPVLLSALKPLLNHIKNEKHTNNANSA